METFIQDAYDVVISGNADIVTKPVVLASGAAVDQYTVLGQVTATGKFKKAVTTASDGSQVPVAIAAVYANSASADVTAPVFLGGTFNPEALVWDASFDATKKTVAFVGTNITLVAPGYSG